MCENAFGASVTDAGGGVSATGGWERARFTPPIGYDLVLWLVHDSIRSGGNGASPLAMIRKVSVAIKNTSLDTITIVIGHTDDTEATI